MGLSAELSAECALENDGLFRHNFAANLPMVKACPGISKLAGALLGQKVIVVGAGPSLSEAIPALKETALPIIACDRAARPLLEAGINPDWIITVEVQWLGGRKMAGLRGLESIPLVFDPICWPETVEQYPGPLYTYNRPNIVMNKGALRLGTGVATYAVGLAEALGAEEVILVGVDLSYPGDRMHAAGVAQIPESVPKGSMEIESTAGGMVRTDLCFAAVIEEIGNAAKDTPIVQTSPAGARIPNARHDRLEDVL